jgi:hypothetical protein
MDPLGKSLDDPVDELIRNTIDEAGFSSQIRGLVHIIYNDQTIMLIKNDLR